VVEKMFVHDVTRPLMPKCLSNLQDSINNQLIFKSIKDVVSTHMARECIAKHVVVKELSSTLATYTRTSGRKVTQHLGLSKRCVIKYKQWCFLINNGDLDFWSRTTKRQWSDALSLEVKALMLEWWIMETTISLDQKKVCKKNIGGQTNYVSQPHFGQVRG
jgi:hypothetical protein